MNKSIFLSTAFLITILNVVDGHATKTWESTLNEYISTVVNLACNEKRSPDLNKCDIPADRCKRFTTLVAKRCLGEEVARANPIKRPKDMTEKELLAIIDKAAICTGKTVPIITYYVCPEQHERSWANSSKWLDRR